MTDSDMDGTKNKKKRRQVKRACGNCQRSHTRCENKRPCTRCKNSGMAASCSDVPRKRRMRGDSPELRNDGMALSYDNSRKRKRLRLYPSYIKEMQEDSNGDLEPQPREDESAEEDSDMEEQRSPRTRDHSDDESPNEEDVRQDSDEVEDDLEDSFDRDDEEEYMREAEQEGDAEEDFDEEEKQFINHNNNHNCTKEDMDDRPPQNSSHTNTHSSQQFLYNGAPDVQIPYGSMNWEKIDLPNDPPKEEEEEMATHTTSSSNNSNSTHFPTAHGSSTAQRVEPLDLQSSLPLTLLNSYPIQTRSVSTWREPKDTTLSSLFYGSTSSYYARDRNSTVCKPSPIGASKPFCDTGVDVMDYEPPHASLPRTINPKEKLYLGELMQRQRENYLQGWMN